MATVKLVVHRFTVGDVEDPDLYAGDPLFQWEISEAGSWIMKHAVETPTWYRYVDMNNWGYSYKIIAELREEDATYYNLKYCDYSKSKTMG
jgi:hypothetical protein